MRFRRLVRRSVMILVFSVVCLVAAWRVFQPEEQLRIIILDLLRTELDSTAAIGGLSLRPTAIVLDKCSLNITSAIHIDADRVQVRFSIFEFIANGFKLKNAIRSLTIDNPSASITSINSTDSNSLDWSYNSEFLRPLMGFTKLNSVSISNGSVLTRSNNQEIVRQISGTLHFDKANQVALNLKAVPGLFSGSQIIVTGSADLVQRVFHVELVLEIEDIGSPGTGIQIDGFTNLGGSVKLRLAARGTEDLRLNGTIRARNLRADYLEKINIQNGFVNGDIFGDQLNFNASFAVNGIVLPVEGKLDNLLNPKWQIQIEQSDIELSALTFGMDEDSLIQGDMDLHLDLGDRGTGIEGKFNLTGDQVNYGSLKTQNIKIAFNLDDELLKIDEIYGECLGGILSAEGGVNTKDWSMEGEWFYNRSWSEDEASWSRYRQLNLDVNSTFSHDSTGFSSRGTGKLTIPDGKTVLTSDLSIHDRRFNLKINPERIDQSFLIDATILGDGTDIRLESRNPHLILAGFFNSRHIPDFVSQYELDFSARGDPDSMQVKLGAFLSKDKQGVCVDGLLVESPDDGFGFTGDIKTLFHDGEILSGWSEIRLQGGKLFLERLILKDWSGIPVLDGSGSIALNDLTGSNLKLKADRLPYIKILGLLGLASLENYNGLLDADITGDGQSLKGNFDWNMEFPDSTGFLGSFSCQYNEDEIILQNADFYQESDYEQLLRISGDINLESTPVCTAVVTADQLPVERIKHLLAPGWELDLAGMLDARLELNGPLRNPDVTLDAHYANGTIYGNGGYWSNTRISTRDSLYILENFDLGKGVQGLLQLSGIYNRFTGKHELFINGKGVEVQYLAQAFTGELGPLKGKCSFNAQSSGDGGSYESVWEAEIDMGYIGPLSFKDMDGWIRLTGSSGVAPMLVIDSLKVNWGDADAMITGTLPLMGADSINILGEAKGEFPALLPSLTSFFGRPRGEGEFSFRIGGTLDHPRISRAKLDIRDGSLRFKDVFSGIDQIDATIILGEDGRIHFANLAGTIEDNWISISNRFPDEMDGLETLKFGDYDLGIIGISSGINGIWTVIPNLMKKNWGGFVGLTGYNGDGPFEFTGPASNPSGMGEIHLHNATITYPFIIGGNPTPFGNWLLGILKRTRWDGYIIPGWGCRYIREVSGLREIPLFETIRKGLPSEILDIDVKLYLELFIDENPDGLHVTGSLDDSFYISGELTSERGTIEYLDLDFMAEKIGVRFNPPDLNPLLYGSAVASVVDTAGIPRDISLVIREGGSPMPNEYDVYPSAGVHWENMRIAFEDDQGRSQEEILALMGYAPGHMYEKIAGLGGTLVENVTPIRRWTRMLERQIERWFRVDQIDIEPALAQNIIERQLYPSLYLEDPLYGNYSYISALDQSKLTVGKFLTPSLFVSYTGSLLSGTDIYNVNRLGVIHTWDILLRLKSIAPNLNLSYRYQYDGLSELDDHTVRINYNFFIGK